MIKSFCLGSKKYKVERRSNDSCNLGTCFSPLCLIRIQTIFDGKSIPEESQEQTLFHEVVHAILDDIGERDLSSNERFVQSFSLLMRQFFKTLKE
jgi:Zn-dependent peptidase ImmA (M78 family)